MNFVTCKYVSNVRCAWILKDSNSCDSCDLYKLVLKDNSSSDDENEVN